MDKDINVAVFSLAVWQHFCDIQLTSHNVCSLTIGLIAYSFDADFKFITMGWAAFMQAQTLTFTNLLRNSHETCRRRA